jgi:DNA gyrase/topoisomerase IV subunit A
VWRADRPCAARAVYQTYAPGDQGWVAAENSLERAAGERAILGTVLVALPSIDDGLDDIERALVGAMSSAGATRLVAFRKSTQVLSAIVDAPPRDPEDLERWRGWRAGNDQELRAAAEIFSKLRSIDDNLLAAGRAWRSHPDPVVGAYARLADLGTDFRSRYPLVELNGLWGTIDGEPPADHFYTECRLSAWGELVAESATPNLLVNGYVDRERDRAARFLPRNLREVVDALCRHLDGDTLPPLLPDFPTGGVIPDPHEWQVITQQGRGSLRVRARTQVEDHDGRRAVVVTELPFLVEKSRAVEQADACLRAGGLPGIQDIWDVSDRNGVRVVFDLAADADPSTVVDALCAQTSLEVSIDVEATAMVDGVARWVPDAEIVERTAANLLRHARGDSSDSDQSAVVDAVVARLQALAATHGDARRTSFER